MNNRLGVPGPTRAVTSRLAASTVQGSIQRSPSTKPRRHHDATSIVTEPFGMAGEKRQLLCA